MSGRWSARARRWSIAALAAFVVASASAISAQQRDEIVPSLEKSAPDLNARVVALERAQGVLIGALMAAPGAIDEADLFERMRQRLADRSTIADSEAEKGYAALGARGAEVVRRAQAFQREVVAIFAGVPPADRTRALDAAVQRYRSRPDVALGDAPKDMTILYDHPYTSFVPPRPGETEPRRELRYPRLTGFMWSAHWYQLAVLDPLEEFADSAARNRGLAVVADRLERKLSAGVPPNGFPGESPLAPSIAPGLVAASDRAASIVDNLDIMLDVLTDILVRRDVPDRSELVEQVIAQFTDRGYRCVQVDEWIVVALRHSIFEQGGPALAVMNENERNAFSGAHGQHYAVRREPPSCDPE